MELLRDAQEDLRRSRKRTYPGMGKQTGMFTSLPLNKGNQLGGNEFVQFYCGELWWLSNPWGRLKLQLMELLDISQNWLIHLCIKGCMNGWSSVYSHLRTVVSGSCTKITL